MRKRRLWELVMEKFTEKPGRWSIELTREEMLQAGVFGSDFDEEGRPTAPELDGRRYT